MSGQSNHQASKTLPEQPVLDPAVQQFLDRTVRDGIQSPHELDPLPARTVLDQLQSAIPTWPSAAIDDLVLIAGPTGEIKVRIVRPTRDGEIYPIVLYLHGGAWVTGNTTVYDRLVKELAVSAKAAIVFVDFTLVPEATYPVQIEQSYAALTEIVRIAPELQLDDTKIAIVGDCSGGNMAAAVTLMAKRRRGPEIAFQALLYPIIANPVTSTTADLPREKLWLTPEALRSRLDLAFPDGTAWQDITAFPFNATAVQLNDLPEALVIVAEHDIVRDGAEAYARRLTEAGVLVTCTRYNGVIHDFLLLDALSDAPIVRGALAQVTEALREALCGP